MVRTQVQTVVRRVLGNQVKLLDAIREQRLGLGYDVRLLAAAMRPSHSRYNAKAARVIAPLGNLEVGKMARRQPKARRGIVRDVVGAWRYGKESGGRVSEWVSG